LYSSKNTDREKQARWCASAGFFLEYKAADRTLTTTPI
jgi:hypothetical protein